MHTVKQTQKQETADSRQETGGNRQQPVDKRNHKTEDMKIESDCWGGKKAYS
jgi:hypothetical protein